MDVSRLTDLDDLNARLWAWIEQVYHRRPHGGLNGQTPLERYQQDLPKIRLLGQKAARLDALFHHRVVRKVRKDGTVSYPCRDFEVPDELAGTTVQLVVNPHAATVVGVEDAEGTARGAATPLDGHANAHRRRQRTAAEETAHAENAAVAGRSSLNAVELAYQQDHGQPDREGR